MARRVGAGFVSMSHQPPARCEEISLRAIRSRVSPLVAKRSHWQDGDPATAATFVPWQGGRPETAASHRSPSQTALHFVNSFVMDTVEYTKKCRGLSLISGGLDSQLAICVLRDAGAEVEAVTFETPFFSSVAARKAAAALGVPLRVIDFTDDEIALVKSPPHGFGGAMNPCIDCHATMIRRAGELMAPR